MITENKCIYSSSGCNRGPNTLDWGENNLICYAACNAIHLIRYEEPGAAHFQTLLGHKKLITSVHWIKGKQNEIISTSADKTAGIWTLQDNKFVKTSTLTGHTDVVQTASGIYVEGSEKDLILATLSTDSTLKVWERETKYSVQCVQTISFGNGFGLDVKFACLENCELAMLVSSDDAKIRIYVQDEVNQFLPILNLEGHEDWIQSLDVFYKDDNLMVVSASQDSYIRIWKILPKQQLTNNKDDDLRVDEATFSTLKGQTYSVVIDSVLSGHENRVYSARWSFKHKAGSLQILSASMDKTMIVWEIDTNSNIWMEKVRVGEVGGNTLGFFGGVFSPDNNIIMAHGYQGAIHIWKLNEELGSWIPGTPFGGHFSPVTDIDWDPEGEYLMSCSSDQTTRIHAPYVTGDQKNQWLELARPQVHGYDMVCLCLLNRFQFVSAGDEKVLRVFQAPRSFAETLKNISKIDTSSYIQNNVAEGASVPSLGLSNKAVFEEDLKRVDAEDNNDLSKHPKDKYPEFYYTPQHLTAPPTEETLIQNTLWPEVQKLYGHPYEVFTVAANHSGTLVASACKASKAEHAAIILWDTSTWKQIGQLTFHNLTVTQIQFSPDDEFLLSVSRDRMWAVYQRSPSESPSYRLIANLDKKNNVHTRIIWSCAWSFDSLFFATASRDKKVAIWGKNSNGSEVEFSLCLQPLEVEDSATALSFAPCQTSNNKYILAVGLEKGSITLNTWCSTSGFSVCIKLEENIAHHYTVNKLKFSPKRGEAGNRNSSDVIQLASCSNDSHVKIFNILISSLC